MDINRKCYGAMGYGAMGYGRNVERMRKDSINKEHLDISK